ncbi:hypothetical protein [Thorsellia anophelis]|uniref:Uncharacterized protein n=1 Tax=Thorsellia anophelis DSM 18579 TaxID=1123402 RepID=A0A1I0BAL8_9GAMM|nr:hypothetical protein [Thorsellia anophelis]SET03483.1 hypothetical protein SAMN02583745_01201 [Thorsellia anophelis DSM 18579]
MSILIKLGLKQGSVIGFSGNLTRESFSSLADQFKKGRYGLFTGRGINQDQLYVVLTQDCTISTGKHIEVAQLKQKNIKELTKSKHLFLGKDYNKLYIQFNDLYYEVEECLLTKVNSELLTNSIQNNNIEIK